MRKLLFLLMLATVSVNAQTDVVKFAGKIANRNSDMITLKGPDKFKQTIPVAKDGTFSTSFAAPEGMYEFTDGVEFTDLYLKNGFDIKMNMDAQQFDESIVYTGKGSVENNILAKKTLDEEALEPKMMALQSKPEEMMKLVNEYNAALNARMTATGVDPGLKKAYDAKNKAMAAENAKMREEMEAQKKAAMKLEGNISPEFAYENHKGGTTKLSDLRGKYVYIDTWATWCGPCRAEIPFLQKTEEKYKGKNIEFVSISVDVKKDYDKWKKMVAEKQLGGTQLFADNDWNSDFVTAYGIKSIPRFILIGPDGKVISADAERPSSPELAARLDKLLN